MAFEKGQSGNPFGRRKGTPNKSTNELRHFIQEVISSNFSKAKIARDLKELPAKNRLDLLLKLMEYILPKPVPAEIVEKPDGQKFYSNMLMMLKEGSDARPDKNT